MTEIEVSWHFIYIFYCAIRMECKIDHTGSTQMLQPSSDSGQKLVSSEWTSCEQSHVALPLLSPNL